MVEQTIALKTSDGQHYLTVVNGGGLGGPNSGPGAVALHSDQVNPGSWEQFQFEWTPGTNDLSIKTEAGNYITAIDGGGHGGPNDSTCPIHTDAVAIGQWEQLVMSYDPATNLGTMRTFDGHYLTAVNGSGSGGPNDVPIHTDATVAGPWEAFSAEPVP